jgi:hypothetical protein
MAYDTDLDERISKILSYWKKTGKMLMLETSC